MNANKIKRMKLVGHSPNFVSMVRSQVPPVCGNSCDSHALLRFSASILFLITAVLLAPAYASPEAPPSTELAFRTWGTNVNPAGQVEGRNAWRSTRYKDQKAARYFYFGVLRPELKNGNAQSVEVVIHYLDQEAVKLHLEYDPADGAALKKTEAIETSGSGGWKEAKWQIPDAGFRNRANAHDFCLVVEGNPKFTCKLEKPVQAIAVRVIGKPASGSNPMGAFSSCAELQAFGRKAAPGATGEISNQTDTNLLPGGVESRSRKGNTEGSIIDDNVASFVVTFEPTSAREGEDWYAVTIPKPATVSRIVFAHGKNFPDGGWFDTSAGKPRVQIQLTKDAPWETVGELTDYPKTTATDNGGLGEGDVDFVIGECTVSGSPRFHTILPDVFSEHMVLQRDTPIPVWGLGRDDDKVKVELAGKSYETIVKEGKWKLLLDAQNVSSTPAKLVISASDGFRKEINDVLVGDVWFAAGQSNMEMKVAYVEGGPVALAEPHAEALRLFNVSPFLENSAAPMGSKWAPSSLNSATEMSAVAWFFGREIQKTEGIPVGIINCSFGGTITETWCSPGTLAKGFPDWEAFNAQNLNQPNKNEWSRIYTASRLYLHMIQTIAPFPVKGFLWYQGEANAGRAAEQKRLFPAMVDGWRQAWGNPSLPIFFAQLARFQEADWHDFRDAQRWIAANNPNMYLAVTIDLPRDFGPNDSPVHPRSKIPIAHRMALAARANIYGEKNLEWSGPQVKSWSVDGDAAVLEFSHATGGLTAQGGGPLRGFFLSGDGKKFTEAVATIQGSALRLRAEGVQKPITVRYGSEADQGKEKLEVNLANQEGLPASPFTLL
jgi:sialate O-acetylesterase